MKRKVPVKSPCGVNEHYVVLDGCPGSYKYPAGARQADLLGVVWRVKATSHSAEECIFEYNAVLRTRSVEYRFVIEQIIKTP